MMNESQLLKNVNLLYELGTMRHVDRTWVQFHMREASNIAEHTMRVQWIAILLAKMEGIDDINQLARIALMALVHDVPELRTGDPHYISRLYTTKKEQEAITDIFSNTILESIAIPLWKEAEEKQTLEAKLIKDADNIDVDLELRELEARGHKIIDQFREVRMHLRSEKLYTESAKQLFDALYKISPFQWIADAKNRSNSGDWKKS